MSAGQILDVKNAGCWQHLHCQRASWRIVLTSDAGILTANQLKSEEPNQHIQYPLVFLRDRLGMVLLPNHIDEYFVRMNTLCKS